MSSNGHHGNPVATYIITALILAVITYIEFAIVEYEIPWLSPAWIIFWLVLLSIVKFVMVVAIFMHLKDDETTYTGFFSSGMVLAVATFFVMPLLFTVRNIPAWDQALELEPGGHEQQAEAGHGGHGAHGLSDDVRQLIETDGYSRPLQQVLGTPRPKARSLAFDLPAAREGGFSLDTAGPMFRRPGDAEPLALAGADEDADEAEGAEDAATEESPVEAEQIDGEELETQQVAVDPADDEDATEQQVEAEEADEDETAGDEEATGDDGAGTTEEAAQGDFDRELGEGTYVSNCQSCHQASGEGMAGVFPPLAGNMPRIHEAEGGREYLIDVLLFGLQGRIEVDGQEYNGAMPGWSSFSDEQVAAVLNHELTSWGNDEQMDDFEPISAAEVEARRGQDTSAEELAERREQLDIQ